MLVANIKIWKSHLNIREGWITTPIDPHLYTLGWPGDSNDNLESADVGHLHFTGHHGTVYSCSIC